MATSGTYDQVQFTVATLLDQAILRAGKLTSEITAEDIQTAIREFNLMVTSDWSNRGLKLWAIENSYYGLYVGQRAYPLDLNTIDVKNANIRTIQRLTGSGTPASSAGGTVEYAFDGDVDTALNQVAINGNVSYYFFTPVSVTFIGILPDATSSMAYVVEASDDGVSWNVYYTIGAQTYTDGVWFWADMPIFNNHPYWRLRETAGGTINVRELVFANGTNDINLFRLTRDDYSTLPNKAQMNRPVQYWWNRERTQPEMVLWPVPNNTFEVLNVYRSRNIQDVTGVRQEVEVPRRWWKALVEGLAKECIRCNIGSKDNLPSVQSEYNSALFLAENEEQDSGIVYMTPNLRGYTR